MEISDYQSLIQGLKSKNFKLENPSTNLKLRMETLIEETKSVMTGKKSLNMEIFQYQWNLFLALPLYQFSHARNKINDFSMEYSRTSGKFSIETQVKSLNLVFLSKSFIIKKSILFGFYDIHSM